MRLRFTTFYGDFPPLNSLRGYGSSAFHPTQILRSRPDLARQILAQLATPLGHPLI
jgi:hypothetical protein